MSEVYYLKYRPQKVSQLDLKDIREQLSQLLSSKNIPHALLFSGPKGLGKTSAARIIAKAINCQTRKNIEPCNKCDICQSITRGTSLDLIEIDAASNRGIDDIRELREKIKLAPTQAKKKVYVIDEVHMLTKEAFNALLKTLEEPPEHAFFILCTTEPEKLPETIISRCQRFNFRMAKPEEIKRSLKRIVKGEKLKISDKALDLISQKAEASFRDASKVLQQLAFTGKNISLKQVEGLLKKEGKAEQEILSLLAGQEIKEALQELSQVIKRGIDLKDLSIRILESLRQMLLGKYGVLPEKKEDFGLTIDQIKELILLFDQASRELKGAVIPQLSLELAIVNFKSLRPNRKTIVTNNQDNLEKWQQVLEVIKKDNPTVEGLLKATNLSSIEDKNFVVEVFYEFHKNKLETEEYISLVEKTISDIFGRNLKVSYELKPAKS